MKLLFCSNCNDIFNLNHKEKRCGCGKVSGKYIDNINAVTNGKGYSLAIGNGSFDIALNSSILYTKGKEKINREFYLDNCKFTAWCRPNEGSGNPHMKVEEE